ncbi:50S ribosomal protein L6, partial [candidate division WWE3 bacterium]|nr:50S ribosomal protein L6 [candidate division WWE3 bacterium]
MSRIGKKEIQIPSGVTVSVENRVVIVTGPKGKLTHSLRPEIKVEVLDNKIVTSLSKTTKGSTAFWGMTRAIINNMVIGVTSGFEKTLEL